MGIVEERAVTVDSRIFPLGKDLVDRLRVQVMVECGSPGLLYAVDRPEHLPETGQLNDVSRLATLVMRRKAPVIWRMPILAGYDPVEPRHKPVRYCYDLVSVLNR